MYETTSTRHTSFSDGDYTSYNSSEEKKSNNELDIELKDTADSGNADTSSGMTNMPVEVAGDGQGSTITSSSNGGTPLENPNIPANVDDGNDLEKLDFSAEYASPNGMGDDLLSGTSGANTFEVNALLNAKPEIVQKHVDGEGRVDWEGVTGENNNYHDHWLDSLGQDTISEFSGSGGEGDKINISGHTVAVTLLEETDNQVELGIYADQDADGNRGTGAHDFDVIGTLTVNHDGNFDYAKDISVNAESNAGAFEFA